MDSSDELYVSRDRAAQLYDGTAEDIFQGDIYHRLEFALPTRSGSREFPAGPGIVVSHDCEFTKLARWGDGYRLLVAPLREIRQFDKPGGVLGHVRANRVRFLFYLPPVPGLEGEFAADLTTMQPFTAAELLDAEVAQCLGPALKPALQGALAVFFTDRRPGGS